MVEKTHYQPGKRVHLEGELTLEGRGISLENVLDLTIEERAVA